jgi:hypothetical protein
METRQIGGSRRSNNERYERVPVCLVYTLDAIELVPSPGCWPFYREPHYLRTR